MVLFNSDAKSSRVNLPCARPGFTHKKTKNGKRMGKEGYFTKLKGRFAQTYEGHRKVGPVRVKGGKVFIARKTKVK